MRRGSINIVEQHIEKVILLAAVGFAGYLGFIFFLGNPYTVDYRGKQVGPTELDEEILQAARELETRINNQTPPDVPPVENTSEKLESQMKEGVWAKVGVLERSVPFGRPLVIPGETPAPGAAIPLIRPFPPTNPIVFGGRSLVDRQQVNFGGAAAGGGEEAEVSWITVAGYWDRESQREAHRQAGYVSYRQLPYMLPPDVERQEILPTGEWSEWELVHDSRAMPALEIPELEFDPITGDPANKSELDATFELVKSVQLNLIQPRFYDVLAGDPWFIPELAGYTEAELVRRAEALEAEKATAAENRNRNEIEDPQGNRNDDRERRRRSNDDDYADDDDNRGNRNNAVKAGKDAARELADAAKRAYVEGDDAAALESLEAAMDSGRLPGVVRREVDLLQKLIEKRANKLALAQPRWNGGIKQITAEDDPKTYAIWFNDDTVEPGKTYRYRLRANIWNRYLNKPIGLANPADSRLVVLNGEWSEPTPAIEAPPAHQVFVIRTDPDRTIRTTVWKWHRGWWFDQTFDVAVGDEIGEVKNIRMPLVDPALGGNNNGREEVDFATGIYLADVRLDEPRGERDVNSRNSIEYDTPKTSVVVLRDTDGDTYEQRLFKGRAPNPNADGVSRR